MWAFTKPIELIRYLFVWRINGPLVRLPRCLSAELSLVLGSAIADHLPTRQARPWRQALSPWDKYGGLAALGKQKINRPPEAPWPVETVLFPYPGKLVYGPGEMILWELKLLGESADHGFFLETILPAVEAVGSASDQQWRRLNKLWGRFEIHAVYAAHGPRWEPIVSAGRLDLSYRPTPDQWADGLPFDAESKRVLDRLVWVTPFDFSDGAGGGRRKRKKRPPTLEDILEALKLRMSLLLPGKHHTSDDVWDVLSAEDQAAFRSALELAARIPVRRADLEPAPKRWPGRWIGTQTFPSIPGPLVPYLELASILHVGRQTHLGCGTFRLE